MQARMLQLLLHQLFDSFGCTNWVRILSSSKKFAAWRTLRLPFYRALAVLLASRFLQAGACANVH